MISTAAAAAAALAVATAAAPAPMPMLYGLAPQKADSWLTTISDEGAIAPVAGGVPLVGDLASQNLATIDSHV